MSYPRRVRRLLIVLASVALLAAGCGGGGNTSGPPLTKEAYQAKLKSISADIAKSVGETTSSGKVPQQNVDKLVKAFHTFADRLGEVNPPAEVKQLHGRLIKALDDLGDEFPDIAKKLNSAGDASAGIAALLGAKSIQELVKLGNDFKAKGYNLNLNQ
jgi:hypothetical protein